MSIFAVNGAEDKLKDMGRRTYGGVWSVACYGLSLLIFYIE
jgi:hypothetical protein